MGLSALLARTAARSAHVLVVEVPGWWRTRAAVERAVRDRGWRPALSAADADVLVVCGPPGPRLSEAIELVWDQMPGPRVRVDVQEYGDAADRLDEAHARLLDTAHHRHDARHRPSAQDLLADDSGEGDHGEMDHGEMDRGEMDHGEMDHGEMDHGGHEHLHHGDMSMSPGGIPLAEGGEDRDGLEMDVLNVRLGPVLPHWPAGLVLRCSLQGDVIVEAVAELVDPVEHPDAGADHPACRLDDLAAVLALAGWDDAAAQARTMRDALLDPGADDGANAAPLEDLHRRVHRSRTLRWSLRGLRPLTEEDVRRHHLPGGLVGDGHDRLVRMLDHARAGAGGDGGGAGDGAPRTYTPRHVARLVTGLDLATARLVVAGLGLHGLRPDHDQDHSDHTPREAAHD